LRCITEAAVDIMEEEEVVCMEEALEEEDTFMWVVAQFMWVERRTSQLHQ